MIGAQRKPTLFGMQVITEPNFTELKQVKKPKFRHYGPLRHFQWYRDLRAFYMRAVRRKYATNRDNWARVPSQKVLVLGDNKYVMHPSIYAKLKEQYSE